MRRLSTAIALIVLGTAAVGSAPAGAAPDHANLPPFAAPPIVDASATEMTVDRQLAEVQLTTRPKRPVLTPDDKALYSVLSDQIREMRRKSALPAVMCLAEYDGDGTARTLPDRVMAQLVADNAEADDGLFTLKSATACVSVNDRIVDAETYSRAMFIAAGPVEDDMKDLMADCGEMVGGFVRAGDDSDFDFYAVNGGDVTRKLGCEMAQ